MVLVGATVCGDPASPSRGDASVAPPADTGPAAVDLDVGVLSDTRPQQDATGDLPPSPDADVDPSAALYPRESVLQVEIRLADRDWDRLRHEDRSDWAVFAGDDCFAAPFGSPFTWFRGRVVVDGQTVESVGVRKKGFLGSLDTRRPSLKLKFDKFVDGQLLAGRERLTLNNALSDPAVVRQCLAYDTFAAAGVPAPRCSFAHVVVNGESLGVYANVEPVMKRFVRRNFPDDDGALFEGTLSDFTPAWRGTFDQKTGPPSAAVVLDDLVAALAQPDESLLDGVRPLVDLEAFFRYWAVESLLGAFDSYSSNSNNFFVYQRPSTGRLVFIPWGMDEIFPPELEQADEIPVQLVEGELARRLYRLGPARARYHQRLRTLLDTVWDGEAVLSEIDRMAALVEPFVTRKQRLEMGPALAWLRDVVASRAAHVEIGLNEALNVDSEPRPTYCLPDTGELSALFTTRWGTLDADPFDVGSGELAVLIDGRLYEGATVGATAGVDEGWGVLAIFGEQPDGSVIGVFVQFDAQPDRQAGLQQVGDGFVMRFEGDNDELLGILTGAELQLDRVDEVISGVLVARVVAPGW